MMSCATALIESLQLYWRMGRLAPMAKVFPLVLALELSDAERTAVLHLQARFYMVVGATDELRECCAALKAESGDKWATQVLEDITRGEAWEARARGMVVRKQPRTLPAIRATIPWMAPTYWATYPPVRKHQVATAKAKLVE